MKSPAFSWENNYKSSYTLLSLLKNNEMGSVHPERHHLVSAIQQYYRCTMYNALIFYIHRALCCSNNSSWNRDCQKIFLYFDRMQFNGALKAASQQSIYKPSRVTRACTPMEIRPGLFKQYRLYLLETVCDTPT
jgi:hypothetical protein